MSSADASTITTSATASSTDANGGRNSSFIFSGGSTLILAFLAFGLFVGGLLVVYSMRRYVLSHRRRLERWEGTRRRPWHTDWDQAQGRTLLLGVNVSRRQQDFGKKPELWDICAVKAQDAGWENVQPIAARMALEGAACPEPRPAGQPLSHSAASGQNSLSSNPSEPGLFYPFQVGLRDFAVQVSVLRPPRQIILDPPYPQHSPPDTIPPNNAFSAAQSYAQLALAIVMPMEGQTQAGVPLYALGVASVRLDSTADHVTE